MTTALKNAPEVTAIEKVMLNGDLKDLQPAERLAYYNSVCESLGLNPLTQPFAYLSLSGKMVLYARKDAGEQLRLVRRVSCKIICREIIDGIYVVTTEASLPDGRVDSSIGAVAIESLKGEARANAMMKAETKSKRRVTLSICGLGMLDESEIETVQGARLVNVEQAHTLIEAGNDGGAGNAATASSGVHEARPIPDELRLVIESMRRGDFSSVKTASAYLETECRNLGISAVWVNRIAGFRASFPKGKAFPPEAMEGLMLDVWGEIEKARAARAEVMRPGTEAPEDKAMADRESYRASDEDVPF